MKNSQTRLSQILNWDLFPAIIWFNLAYLMADLSTICCILMIGAGLSQLTRVYYDSLSIEPKERAVVITGCDSGHGHQLAEKLHDMNFYVFACCLDETSKGSLSLQSNGKRTGRMHVIHMDVNVQKDVDDARKYVENHLPLMGVWGIVNNADRYDVGFLEWLPVETYETLASVNLFGAIRVTKAFLPLIRKNKGRIINVSSILGRVAAPFVGAYCITKHGLEAFSDVLRLEMKPFQVQVSTIEPGNNLSSANSNSCKDGLVLMARHMWYQLDESLQKDYMRDDLERQIRISEMLIKLSKSDGRFVINAMTEALYREHPKNRYLETSIFDKILTFLIRFLPHSWIDRLRLIFHEQLLTIYQSSIVWRVFFSGAGLAQLFLIVYKTVSIWPKGRAVLITGCDSGFGHLLAERLHAMEFTVFACLKNEKTSDVALGLLKIGTNTGRMHVIQMDVTIQKDVDRARQIVEAHLPTKGLWGVVNNANRYRIGFLEWTSNEAYETILSVNVCGVIRVTKTFLPLICRSQGRIINVSSILGRVAEPFIGAYCMSKFALEAYSDILRLELYPLKVKVIIIEPGHFMSAVNFIAGKDGLNAKTREMWNQLPESVKADYGEESLLRQTRIWEQYLNLAERDISFVINAMSDSLCRMFPKYRYLEANLFDKAMAYCIQFFPNLLTDRLRFFIQAQLLSN
uniref:Uncharacterized protein n=1 Tax=Daphnia galeata TaxID=27404 RepID=A0A8J2RZI6_9CRUS|nr:unnamed protein product [Daphnia galeata]